MRQRRRTVQGRTTIAAAVVTGGVLILGGLSLIVVLATSQLQAIDAGLELRADDTVALFQERANLDGLAVEDADDSFVQVVSDRRIVLASSPNIRPSDPLVDVDRPGTRTQEVPGLDEDHEFRVLVRRVEEGSDFSVVVGTNLEYQVRTLRTVAIAILVGLPLTLGLLALMTWRLVGQALRPVESIRAEVDDIGGGDLHRRVPEPETSDEIGRLARTMNEMLDRLQGSQDTLARFVGDASHELRTPIAIIRHELEVALRTDDQMALREAAGDVLEETQRMQHLVEDLLLLARQEGKLRSAAETTPTLVDLDDIALDQARRMQVQHHVDTSGIGAGQVRGSEQALSRLVRNLLDNAARHARSTVAISVESRDGSVLLNVDDDGPGVAAADRTRIFDRFARADDARSRDAGGTGLGLSIVHGVAHDHGGTVEVTTSPTLGGARFTTALPDARL